MGCTMQFQDLTITINDTRRHASVAPHFLGLETSNADASGGNAGDATVACKA